MHDASHQPCFTMPSLDQAPSPYSKQGIAVYNQQPRSKPGCSRWLPEKASGTRWGDVYTTSTPPPLALAPHSGHLMFIIGDAAQRGALTSEQPRTGEKWCH